MVGSGQALQLASIKAVETGYPLRGTLKSAPDMLAQPDTAPTPAPTPGTAWVDPQLLAMPGGEPVIVDGLAIGGVGISGLPPALDAELAARFVQRLT